jgi:inorganic pyrophosphatase
MRQLREAPSTVMLHTLPPLDRTTGLTHVIIDTAKGSRNKVKFDEALGCFRLSRILPVGMAFPFNFGFIPSTRADDGDALDVVVLMDEPLPTATLVTVRLIGVLLAVQSQAGHAERNDRLIAVAQTPVNTPVERSLADVDKNVLAELTHFFVSYNSAQGRTFRVMGRQGPSAAAAQLRKGMRKYEKEKRC